MLHRANLSYTFFFNLQKENSFYGPENKKKNTKKTKPFPGS